jgi:uncharacterized membrane protein YfcA
MQFILVGVVAGVLAGMFGIGGGVIIVPVLVLVAKMKPQMATGTSLGALLLPVGALGAWIAVGLVLGAYLGAQFALRLPARELQRIFAVFLLFMAVHLWITA